MPTVAELLESAQGHLARGSPDLAIAALHAATLAASDDAEPLLAMGDVLRQLGRGDDAVASTLQASE